jgi:hypothetical protein
LLNQLPTLRVDLVLSIEALGKPRTSQSPIEVRCDLLVRVFEHEPRCRIVITSQSLLSDIALGYDYLILGSDKEAQLQDPVFYESPASMAEKLARLPKLITFPRAQAIPNAPGSPWALPQDLRFVSSTEARSGSWEYVDPLIRERCQTIYGSA